MKKAIYLLAVVVLLSLTVVGCKKDKGKPPVLPPYESMSIDFSDFQAGKKSADLFTAAKDVPDPDENFTFSATVAGIWNTILTVNLVVPVTAFKLAENSSPKWIADKTWQWNYSVTGITGTYKARLVGKIQATNVKWEMYIKREGSGAFDEFMWFEGTTASDGKSGQWILSYDNTKPVPYLRIDWTKTGTTIGTVKYTYIREQNDAGGADPFKNSYIEYGLTSASLNGYYTVHIYESLVIQDFVDVFIEWNTTAGNGHVKALYKFGDNNWHCWDTERNNTPCPI
jgi:hypothetical protein